MISVLRDWLEVGEAITLLSRSALPLHPTPQKNWDHALLTSIVAGLPTSARIIDLGCGDGYTLMLLQALGFTDITGIDLILNKRLRIRQAREMWRRSTLKIPFKLYRADLTDTRLPHGSFDAAVSISTIEHGVDLPAFAAEASRLLKPGGVLFMTTDYWEDSIEVGESSTPFGLPWRVFDRAALEQLLLIASAVGLKLIGDGRIPGCTKRTVVWNSVEYTFVAIGLRKWENENHSMKIEKTRHRSANEQLIH